MSTDSSSARTDLSHKSPDELQGDIAETRARISRNADDLAYRLSPESLGQDVKATVADTQQLTFGAIEGLGDRLLERTHGWGGQTREFAKRHSVPVTLLGLGFAWLLMRSSRR